MSSITLSNVSKKYGPVLYAVENVNISISEGEFFVLLGPSGCGKSTTLRMIAGLETISEGELEIGGESMTHVDPADRDLAFVFQNYALYPHFTVKRNLGFGLKLRGVKADEIAQRSIAVAEMLGIEQLLDRKPRELSGGQQQRVALGRALIREPVAFLFDEPLSNLDAKLRAKMRTELIKLHNRFKMTIVHVTHDHVEAMTMADRICIMDEGRVVQVGPPMEVYQNPVNTFVAGFLASPPMNLIPCKLEKLDAHLRVVFDGFSLNVPEEFTSDYESSIGKDLIFGIRAEDFHLPDMSDKHALLDVETVAIEAMGPETVLVGDIGNGHEISARMSRNFVSKIGDQQQLAIAMNEMQLFDAESMNRIPRGVSGLCQKKTG